MGFGDHRLLLRRLRVPVAVPAIDTALRISNSKGRSAADPPKLRWHLRAAPGGLASGSKGSSFPFKTLSFGVSCLHFTQPRIQAGAGHPSLSVLSVSIRAFLRHPPQNVPSCGRVNPGAKEAPHALLVLKQRHGKWM